MGERPALSVVVVAYNSASDLEAMLPLIQHPAIEVIVVDNASADGGAEVADATGAIVIASPTNLGWTRGGNVGAQRATAPVLAFVNPDTRATAADLLQLVDELQRRSLTAISPRFIEPGSGKLQSSAYFRFPDPLTGAFCFFGIGARLDQLLFGRRFIRRRTYGFSTELPGQVDQPGGALIVVTREAYDALDGFDEEMFLFFSDTDFYRRLVDAGWPIDVAWEVPVPHRGAGSVRALDALTLRSMLQSDYVIYSRRHYGLIGRAVTVFAVVVLTGLLPALGYLLRASPSRARRHAETARRVLRHEPWIPADAA